MVLLNTHPLLENIATEFFLHHLSLLVRTSISNSILMDQEQTKDSSWYIPQLKVISLDKFYLKHMKLSLYIYLQLETNSFVLSKRLTYH